MSDGTPPPPRPEDPDHTPPPGEPTPTPGGQVPPGDPTPGWGAPPPAGPPGAAPPPPPPLPGSGPSRPYSPTDAIGYGWNKFKANPAPLLLGTLILLAVAGVISWVSNAVVAGILVSEPSTVLRPDGTIEIDGGGGFVAGLLVSMLVSLLVGLVSQVIVAGLIKGALDTVDGKPVSVGGMFEGWDKGKVIVAALIVSVATALGTLLCYFPGLIVGFLLSYTMFFVVDRGMEPMEAVKASYSFVTGNLSATLVYYLLGVLVVIAGAILCGVGLLAAVPIAMLGAAYTFRRLHGQEVTPA